MAYIGKIYGAIRQAYLSLVDDDSSEYPRTQATYNGKASSVVRMSPYGLCTSPPEGSLCVLLSSQNQESVKFALIDDMPRRFRDLKEGEVVLYNYMSGSYAYFKESGDIEVVCKNNADITVDGDLTANIAGELKASAGSSAEIEAPTITLTGDVVVTGTISGPGGSPLNADNDITIGSIQLGTHVHGGVQTGSGTSGGPQ